MSNAGKIAANELDLNLQLTSDEGEIKEYEDKWTRAQDDNLIRFQYASLLARSARTSNKIESLLHFEYLYGKALYTRECLHNLATVRYALGEYDLARKCCEELVRQEPDNIQVLKLHKAIAYKHNEATREKADVESAQVGIAVGLGLVAAVGVGLAFLLKRR